MTKNNLVTDKIILHSIVKDEGVPHCTEGIAETNSEFKMLAFFSKGRQYKFRQNSQLKAQAI